MKPRLSQVGHCFLFNSMSSRACGGT